MTIYREIYDGPPSGYRASRGPKKYVGLHNTSNDASVRDELSYSKWRPDKTSTHYYGDNLEIAQSLDTALCANHAGSAEGNNFAIAWEFTGTNGKSRAWWMANVVWAKVAQQMARDCREFGIPPRLLTVAEMRGGVAKGFVTHDLMRQAWGGTTHTDPGPGFPVDYLLALVAAELEGDMQLSDLLSDKKTTVNNALLTVLARTDYLANRLGLEARLTASETRELAQAAALKALAELGGVDAAPIVAAVNRVGDELGERIARLEAENEALRAQLAAVPAAVVDEFAHELVDDAKPAA